MSRGIIPHLDLDDYLGRRDTEVPYTASCPREKRIIRLAGELVEPYVARPLADLHRWKPA